MNLLVFTSFLFLVVSVFAQTVEPKNLVVKIVEAGKTPIEKATMQDVRVPFAGQAKPVFEKSNWICTRTAFSDWGVFQCVNSKEEFTVSTRFNCKMNKDLESSRSFHLFKKNQLNVTFSLWCEV